MYSTVANIKTFLNYAKLNRNLNYIKNWDYLKATLIQTGEDIIARENETVRIDFFQILTLMAERRE